MHKHKHDHCKHATIKHCSQCDVAYCEKCAKEWRQCNHNTWTYGTGVTLCGDTTTTATAGNTIVTNTGGCSHT